MEQFSAIYNLIVGISVIAMQAIIVILLVAILAKHRPLLNWIAEKKTHLLFAISAGALIGSLIYSNVIGFSACYLCWIQRGLMLPIAVITAIGVLKKIASKTIVRICLVFIAAGVVVATYHTLIQNGIGEGSSICQALGGISCTQLYVNQFGYITIPVMSLTVFVLLAIIALVKKPKQT